MKLRAAAALVPLSLVLGLLAGAPSAAAQDTGWIRWANWAPSCPQVDMYLYSFGNSTAATVIKHVRYGNVSSYAAIAAGTYSITMRDTGAAPTSPPELSASVRVAPGTAYTIVSMGPASHLGVQVLTERMNSIPGRALVRVVQESLQQHRVTATDGSRPLGGPLLLGSYTGYLSVPPRLADHQRRRQKRIRNQTGVPAREHHSHPRRARQNGGPADRQPAGRGGQPDHAAR